MEATIGEFLRTRRDRIKPAQVGLPSGITRRRVPGLRREEVALLAGVSPDYYVRLEQGRTRHVSDQILEAVARVLSLSDVEAEHLRNLTRPTRAGGAHTRAGGSVPDEPLIRVIDTMVDAPALLVDTRLDILATNAAAAAVFGINPADSRERPNAARRLFLHPDSRSQYANWEAMAADAVAQLQLMAGRWPHDAALVSLIGELTMRSDPFRRLWATGDVREKRVGSAQILHPVVGALDFEYHVLTPPARPDRSVLVYLPVPGSPTADAVQVLLSWVADRDGSSGQDPVRPLSGNPEG